MTLRAFFGDKEHAFQLTPPLVAELERLTGQGIGGLSRRTIAGEFHLATLHHVIRLALIGGNETSPEEAQALIAAYVAPRPVLKAFALAVSILDHLMTGALPEADEPPTEDPTTEDAVEEAA
jgi:hypothetical protein